MYELLYCPTEHETQWDEYAASTDKLQHLMKTIVRLKMVCPQMTINNEENHDYHLGFSS